MFKMFVWLSFPACLCAVCAFSWWRGSLAERYGGLLIFAANAVADLVLYLCYPQFPSMVMCGIDFLLAAGLLAVALRFSSLWLGAAMLLQSGALCLHALDLGQDGPSRDMHFVLNDAISYGMLACIVAGAFASWRSRARASAPPFPTSGTFA